MRTDDRLYFDWKAFHAMPPCHKKLSMLLELFHGHVFTLDLCLRKFGQGYFAIGGRPYEDFTALLGFARGEEEVDLKRDLDELMVANSEMQMTLFSAHTAARLLPAELKSSERGKTLTLAVNKAAELNTILADRVRPIVQQHRRGPQREVHCEPLPVE
jgi:hypothetical protein